MRCPACGYVSFDHLAACKSCGKPLPPPPGGRRPSIPAMAPRGPEPPRLAPAAPMAPEPSDGALAGQADQAMADTVPLERPAPGPAAPAPPEEEEAFDFTLPPAVARAPARPAPPPDLPDAFAADFRPAGVILRFAAAWVDGILQVALMLAIGAAFAFSLGAFGRLGGVGDILGLLGSQGPVGLAILTAQALVMMLYSVVFVGWRGQTPGKILLRLKIIRVDGGEVDYVAAFIRWIGYWISTVTLYIGFIMAAFTTNKRALHDMIAGTRVIRL